MHRSGAAQRGEPLAAAIAAMLRALFVGIFSMGAADWRHGLAGIRLGAAGAR
jgi:hypothetical protein